MHVALEHAVLHPLNLKQSVKIARAFGSIATMHPRTTAPPIIKMSGKQLFASTRRIASAPTVTALSGFIPAHIRSKICLIWSKSALAPFERLSSTIIREVCSYFGYQTAFIEFRGGRLKLLDLSARQKRSFVVKNSWMACSAFALLGELQVFLCGGVHPIEGFVIDKTILWVDGNVQTQRSLLTPRRNHGLAYDEESRSVFAFGGSSRSPRKLRKCERFSLRTLQWTHLPPMAEPRTFVTASRHRSSVLVASCYSQTIEVFDLRKETFAAVVKIVLPSYFLGVVAYREGEIFYRAKDWLLKYDDKTGLLMSKMKLERDVQFCFQEMVCGGELVVWQKEFRKILMFSLDDGRMRAVRYASMSDK